MKLNLGYLIFCAILINSCEIDHKIQSSLERRSLPVEEVYDIEISYTENAKVKMKVTASKMNRLLYPTEKRLFYGDIVVFFQKDPTEKRSILRCQNATINSNSDIIVVEDDLTLTFFDNKEKKRSILRCDNATINIESGLFIARENVELTNNENMQLITKELFWDQKKDSIYTDKEVKIFDNGDVTIARDGIRSTPDFREYELRNPTGEFYLRQK